MTPFFSICIPQYNRTSFLIEACRSIEMQTERDFEVCISDDVSTDGREAELLEYLRASSLPFVHARRQTNGRYDANLRSAIAMARGRYCLLLGNDDALKSPDTLARLRSAIEQLGQPGVLFTNYEDYASGRVVRHATHTRVMGQGSAAAAASFRRFSFLSGIAIDRQLAVAQETTAWDGSEMYQMFVGCRAIASGATVAETGLVAIRKDIAIPGEAVDSYARRPKVTNDGPAAIPLAQHARLVATAITEGASRLPSAALASVLLQYFGVLYPYWLLEYRRVQSWRYAAAVAGAMRPARTLAGVRATLAVRAFATALYGAMTVAGLLAPVGVLAFAHAPARRMARWMSHWQPSQP